MSPGARRALVIGAVACGALLLLPWGARSLGLIGEPPGSAPSVTPLLPYREGMSLREAYETFPAGAGPVRLLLLQDNADAWVERWRLLAEAEQSLDVSTFILDEDVFGVSFLGHLLRRAGEGVRVRMLVDAVGSRISDSLTGDDLLDWVGSSPNVSMRHYRPLWRRWVDALLHARPRAAIASEHDKILVADGRTSLIGGRNVARKYFVDPQEPGHAFRDLDLLLHSPAVARVLERAFESQYDSDAAVEVADVPAADEAVAASLDMAFRAMDAWLRDGSLPQDLQEELARADLPWGTLVSEQARLAGAFGRPPTPHAEAETRILDSPTRFEGVDPISEGLARLVRSCERRIVVHSPYLVLTERAVELLAEAAGRGVQITILTNSPVSSDNALSQAFFLEKWPELLAAVPTMRLFVSGEENTLHAKCAVFDDQLALVSTYNLDPTSMGANSEVLAAVWSADFAARVAALVGDALSDAPPVVYEYRIARDDAGRVVHEEGGDRPVVLFGPRDHCSPDDWLELSAYWALVRAADDFTGLGPLF